MLVLSRRTKDSIRFPDLDITVEILQIKGSTVRVGVKAPVEINILRGELEDGKSRTNRFIVSAANEHELRNKLNSIAIGMALTKKLISVGQLEQAVSKINSILTELEFEAPAESPQLQALLVEDDVNEREMLAGFLRLHGYQIDCVSDGMEAITYLQSNVKPDLILMDMSMPRLNGAETIRQIRDNPAFDNIKIFAVSGETPTSAHVDTQRNRIAHWFQKPLQPSQLVTAIDQHINHLVPNNN